MCCCFCLDRQSSTRSSPSSFQHHKNSYFESRPQQEQGFARPQREVSFSQVFFRPEKCHNVWEKLCNSYVHSYKIIESFDKKRLYLLKIIPRLFHQNVLINPTIYQSCYLLQKLRQTL